MGAQVTPAVARWRLRTALRQAREATGRTQGQVADALDWSISKVNRIETGEVTISKTDTEAFLRLLGVTDPDEIESYLADTRAARSRGWWDEPKYRDNMTPAMLQLIQFERNATEIRDFQVFILPGLLQTERYADSLVETFADTITPDQRSMRIEARMRRQQELSTRADPPVFLAVIDEFVLQREVGNREIMAEQLGSLIRSAKEANTHLRMLPKNAPPYALLGAFTTYSIGDERDVMLYHEAFITDECVYVTDEITKYRHRFEQIWETSLTEDVTLTAIEARYALTRAEIDRSA